MKPLTGLAIALLMSTAAHQAAAQAVLVWTQCIADRTDGQQRAIVNAKTAEQCAAFSRTCEGANFKQSNFSTNPTTVRNPTLQPCHDTRWPDAPGANGAGKCIVHFRQGGERRWIPGAKSSSECETMAAACAREKGVDHGQPIWDNPAMALPSPTCPINERPQAAAPPRHCYMRLKDERVFRVDIEPASNCRENARLCGTALANDPHPAYYLSNEAQNEVGTCTAADLPRGRRVTGRNTGPAERDSFRSGLPADPPNMRQENAQPAESKVVRATPPLARSTKPKSVASENQCPHNVLLDIEFPARYDADGRERLEVRRLSLRRGMKTSFSTVSTHHERVRIRVQRRQPGESLDAAIDAAWQPFELEGNGDQLLLRLREPWCG